MRDGPELASTVSIERMCPCSPGNCERQHRDDDVHQTVPVPALIVVLRFHGAGRWRTPIIIRDVAEPESLCTAEYCY